jgi:tetratricopeptide (TPR) repeat protein
MAALAILDNTSDAAIGLAVHAGEVLVRHLGDRIEAFGPALKIAEEIERVAPPRTIYLARHTYLPVEGMFQAEPCDAMSLHGLIEPIELLTLTAPAVMAGGWYARVIRGLTAFVGRDFELATLTRIAQKVRSGAGQVAVVVGEPGLGKSRLMHEFFQHDEVGAARWGRLESAATPYDQDTPYYLIGRLLRYWLQLGARLSESEVRARLHDALMALDPELTWAEVALRVPLDLPPDEAWNRLDAGVRRRQLADAVDAVISALAAQRPLILLIEDLHWADSDSAAIVDAIVNRLSRRPVLLLVTTRPEGAPAWMAKSVCHPVRLTSLDEMSAQALVSVLLGDDPSLNEVKRHLIERTGGTPLFLEESVAALIEAGALAGSRGNYRLVSTESELRLPATIQAVLGERIDRLQPPHKLLLQVAAVIGDDVPIDVLRPLMELDAQALDAQLEVLQAAEFLFETQPPPLRRFAFKHALTRDVAYASLLIAQRRKLHRRVLKIILVKLRQRGEDMIERLAHHAVNGERWSLAAKFQRLAGDKSVRRSAYREAVRFFEGGLKVLPNLAVTDASQLWSATLRLRLRPPLGAIAAFTQAYEHLLVAEQIAVSRKDVVRQISIAVHKSYILSSQGQIEAAIAAAEQGRMLADEMQDSLAQLESNLALGQARAFRGDVVGTLEVVEPIRNRLTTELRHERLGQTGVRSVWCLMHLADALTLKGDLDEAKRITQEAIVIADEVDRPYDRAVAHLREGFIEIQAGNAARAVAVFDRSRALAEGSDLGWVAAWARTGLGYAYVLSGHTEAGLHLLEATKRHAAEANFIAVQAMSAVYLADSRRRTGQWREAEAEAVAVLDTARLWGYWDVEVMAVLCLGQIALDRRDSAETALEYLREASDLAEKRGYRLLLAEARQLMASVVDQTGQQNVTAAATLAGDRLLRESR